MSFGDALKELGISENELRAMITRGQLRPQVRNGREMFRRSAIENLKRASKAQPTVILPADKDKGDDEPLPILGDEPLALAPDEPAPLAFEDQSPTEVPALADEDESSVTAETVMPTIELTPQDRQAGGDEEHTDVATQEVSLSDNEEYLILEEGPKARAAAPQPVSAAPSDEAEEEEEEEAEVEPVPASMVGLLAVLTVVMLASMFVFMGAAKGYLPNSGLFGGVSSFLKGILL